jgi:hypothetical protein
MSTKDEESWEGIDPAGTDTKQGILAEVGAISLVALGAFIGKLLFSDKEAAKDTVIINNPAEHNRQGYRKRKNEQTTKLSRSRRRRRF